MPIMYKTVYVQTCCSFSVVFHFETHWMTYGAERMYITYLHFIILHWHVLKRLPDWRSFLPWIPACFRTKHRKNTNTSKLIYTTKNFIQKNILKKHQNPQTKKTHTKPPIFPNTTFAFQICIRDFFTPKQTFTKKQQQQKHKTSTKNTHSQFFPKQLLLSKFASGFFSPQNRLYTKKQHQKTQNLNKKHTFPIFPKTTFAFQICIRVFFHPKTDFIQKNNINKNTKPQ